MDFRVLHFTQLDIILLKYYCIASFLEENILLFIINVLKVFVYATCGVFIHLEK